jgi:septal ring factor EnvC (AmiA/AmiB activator)
MQQSPIKTFRMLPISVVMGFLLLCLALTFIASPPARANEAVTNARAELAATMKALAEAKSQLVIVEKELATARAASAKIDGRACSNSGRNGSSHSKHR